ncbi:hypothetical protein [Candidatus Deianiraea vastatrix]|uniref:SPOR domain-containing protein n=1 Tax=Candidatus Deianiraea vastatrix TaxID=2163644 RepID=A0A5B8XEY0_9RICK|nr:hypothetical protein [Candidatus Deianiraea vastatrix]QED22974.1 hypothetical protein Deia_00165 [Candidatus Deianiraea vastatrix]
MRYFIILLTLFIASCSSSKNIPFVGLKKIPEGNRMLLASIGNIDAIAVTSNDTSFTNNTSYPELDQPRQNILARQMYNNVKPTEIAQDQLLVGKNADETIVFTKSENDQNVNLGNQNITNTKSQNLGKKFVHLGTFKDKTAAEKVANELMQKSSIVFNIEEKNNSFIVKSNQSDKKTAYQVANMALNLGYYDVRVFE